MSTPDRTEDDIHALCDNPIVTIQLLEAERDALQQRVERLRDYSKHLSSPVFAVSEWAAEKHLHPGDLADETGETT